MLIKAIMRLELELIGEVVIQVIVRASIINSVVENKNVNLYQRGQNENGNQGGHGSFVSADQFDLHWPNHALICSVRT